MGQFDFIKKKEHFNLSPEQTIRRMIDYMPEYYTLHEQFINAVKYIENREFGLALVSLLELTSETEHYFSEEFWNGLADAADKMKMKEEAKFCRKQIDRNLKEVKSKTPFGWTTVKFDDTHFHQYISEKLKEEWETKRREMDNVQELVSNDGVHLKSHGRTVYLYIVDKERIAEVEFELGINGLILYFNSLLNWSFPIKQKITTDEKQKIKIDINNWATKTKNAIEFDD